MIEDAGPEAMVDACIAAYEAVKKYGTSDMQLTARILLQLIGEQIAREDSDPTGEASNENVA